MFWPSESGVGTVYYLGFASIKYLRQRPHPRAKTWHKIWMTGLNPTNTCEYYLMYSTRLSQMYHHISITLVQTNISSTSPPLLTVKFCNDSGHFDYRIFIWSDKYLDMNIKALHIDKISRNFSSQTRVITTTLVVLHTVHWVSDILPA